MRFRQRARLSMNYTHPAKSWTRSRALTPTFAGVSYAKLDELGSVQWPCNDGAPEGTPMMHVERFVRGKGKFMLTEYVPTDERTGPRFPLLLTTGRILSQYNVGAQTRRTENSRLARRGRAGDPSVRRRKRGIRDGELVSLAAAASAKSRCARKSPSACSRASSTPPSITRYAAPTW